MAPAASKIVSFDAAAPDLGGSLCASALEGLAGLCEDLCEIARFVWDCISEVGGATERAATAVLGPWFEATVHKLKSLWRSLSSPRSPTSSQPNRRLSLIGVMPMVFVTHLISLLYASFAFGYMPAAGIDLSSPVSMLFHALVFMVLASYVRVCTTDPGSSPDTSEWRTAGQPPRQLEEMKFGSGSARWCRKTQSYKPDRAHYCRVLGKIVLRMDHHCPWVGNTIGFENHKHFFLFLLYASSSCVLTSVDLLRMLLGSVLPPSTLVFLGESAVVTCALSLVIVPLFLFHCWLLSRNMTTIEFCEHRRAAAGGEGQSGASAAASKYDIGLYGNLASVLGENPLAWFLPMGSPPGNGLSFPKPGVQEAAPSESLEEEGSMTAGEDDEPPREHIVALHEEEEASPSAPQHLEGVLAACACVDHAFRDGIDRLLCLCSGQRRRCHGGEKRECCHGPRLQPGRR